MKTTVGLRSLQLAQELSDSIPLTLGLQRIWPGTAGKSWEQAAPALHLEDSPAEEEGRCDPLALARGPLFPSPGSGDTRPLASWGVRKPGQVAWSVQQTVDETVKTSVPGFRPVTPASVPDSQAARLSWV